MREILFRGKAINRDVGYHNTNYKNGDWVYGLVTRLFDERFENLPAEMTNTDGVSGIEIDHKTIGQYTGLTDKNGKEIFEGDIVKGVMYSADFIGVVIWIAEIASFGVTRAERTNPIMIENSSLFKALKIGMRNEHCAEIIGNIHDNPELLKEREQK